MSCADGGVLGPVVGVMGVLQALEAIRVIVTGTEGATSQRRQWFGLNANSESEQQIKAQAPTMLLFSATSSPPFRTIRLRPSRRVNCAACSASASITAESLAEGSMDYVQFCGGGPSGPEPLPVEQRVSAQIMADTLKAPDGPVVLDVRDETQFELCNLVGSVNVPWLDMAGAGKDDEKVKDRVRRALQQGDELKGDKRAFVVCRLGNDSQDAVRKLKQWGFGVNEGWDVKDLVGGLKAWKQEVDSNFPEY
jgi:adenylyltransferase and sulfurtransferase